MGLINQSPQSESSDSTQVTQVTQASKGKSMATATSTKITTGVVRGSYLAVFKAKLPHNAKEGDEPKFSMVCIIPKTDTVTLAKIKAAQEAAINLKWPTKKPPKIDSTLHDGDLPRPSNGEDFGEECKNCMVISVSSKFKPQVIDRQGNEVIDPSEVVSGDYFKVSLQFYAYDFSGKRGVSAGLGNLLFWDKGESLGGTSRATDDFADDIVAQ
jgi:hypothetical protein